jgi:T-complex protein 1 subunit zeta
MSEPNTQETVFLRQDQAQQINFQSCHLLADLFKTNLGPCGTLKMFTSEAGETCVTKDGGEMIQQLTVIHPTALLLTRAGDSQEKSFHDGVSSLITFIDAILRQCEFKLRQGIHPRILVKGLEEARTAAVAYLDGFAIPVRDSRTSQKDYVLSATRTKSGASVADPIVDAIRCVRGDGPIDLDRIDILRIKSTQDSVRLVKGLVIDQAFRHELMPKNMKNVRVLVINVSLEAENTVVNTIIHVANADERERMTIAERKFVDSKLRTLVEFRSLFSGDFLLVNGRGIDGPSMDMLSHANISALRRVSRKTLRRLVHATGCALVNCIDDLAEKVLGFAGKVTEENHRGQKYVFIDDVCEPKAVSIIVTGMLDVTASLRESAVRDGLRALKHAIEDTKVLPGAGAVEIGLHLKLMNEFCKQVPGKARFGVEAFAEALLALPRALIQNAGLEASILVPQMLCEAERGDLAGVDLETGEVIDPSEFGLFDNYCVVRSILQGAPLVASQLLLVDGIIESARAIERKKDE